MDPHLAVGDAREEADALVLNAMLVNRSITVAETLKANSRQHYFDHYRSIVNFLDQPPDISWRQRRRPEAAAAGGSAATAGQPGHGGPAAAG